MGLLRLFLAISVVIAHFGTKIPIKMVFGQEAVQSFFIISGFYMSFVLNEKYISKNNNYFLFISNRLLRLLPLYWLITVLLIVFIKINYSNPFDFFFLLPEYKLFQLSTSAGLLFTWANNFIIGQDWLLFLGLNTTTGQLFFTTDFMKTVPNLHQMTNILPTWSLSLEIAFYSIAPFLVNKSLKRVLLFMLISLALRIYLFYGLELKNDPWTNRFFLTELVLFLLGNISYRVYVNLKNLNIKKYFSATMLLITLALVTFYYKIPEIPILQDYVSFRRIGLYLEIVFAIPILFHLTKTSSWDNFLGELSFPVYLSHFFVKAFIDKHQISCFPYDLDVVVFTLIFALAAVFLFIKPIDKLRQKRIQI